MKPVHIHHGDSREVIKGLADNSIDAVVCDPPYALVSIVKRFGGKDAAPAKSEGASGVYKRASAGFMGQAWDTGETAFDPDFWADVLRVLKPGGHLIAASGTRTYHHLAMAVEAAGFEVRDMISWLYGSGFPKSHDVSKGLAKRREEDVEPVRVVCRFIRAAMDAQGLKSKDIVQHFDGCHPRLIDHWAARDTDSQPSLPTLHQWTTLVAVLSLDKVQGCKKISAEVARLNGRKGTHGARWANAPVIGEVSSTPAGFGDHRFDGDRTLRSLDDGAAKWQGWGTALKPACEPWVLARKPLQGTVAANVLAHGTGALNIDGCRIDGESTKRIKAGGSNQFPHEDDSWTLKTVEVGSDLGRWPANVIHDGSEEVVEGFPSEAGAFAPVRGTEPSNAVNNVLGQRDRVGTFHHGDSGSAARFFYSAKADADDRMGSKHPTVKPIDLMRYLVRLITPPGGVVLDPFAGSGSTGVAAMLEGFESILIEREAQYVADIERKVAFYRGEGRLAAQEKGKVKAEPVNDLPLFTDKTGEAA